MFSPKGRTATDPTLKAALLSSSYACWRNKQHPYPLHLPRAGREAMPQPLTETGPALKQLKDPPGFEYVKRAIERELRVTKDPYYLEFCERCGVSEADRFPPEA